jgi:hypothetical protein
VIAMLGESLLYAVVADGMIGGRRRTKMELVARASTWRRALTRPPARLRRRGRPLAGVAASGGSAAKRNRLRGTPGRRSGS